MSRIDELIAEHCPDGVEFRVLGELGVRNKGTAITAGRMKMIHMEGGPIRVFAGGQTIADVADGAVPEKDVVRVPSIIVKSRGHIGFTYYDRPFTHKAELWSYSINREDVDQKFVYYYLLTQVGILQEIARATSVKLAPPKHQGQFCGIGLFLYGVPPSGVRTGIIQTRTAKDLRCGMRCRGKNKRTAGKISAREQPTGFC